MNDDPKIKYEEFLKLSYPPDLVERLKTISLDDKWLWDYFNLRSNYQIYSDSFDREIAQYQKEHPLNIPFHQLKKLADGSAFKSYFITILQMKQTYAKQVIGTKYAINFFLALLTRLEDVIKANKFSFEEIHNIAETMSLVTSNILSNCISLEFERTIKTIELISVPVIESVYKNILLELGMLYRIPDLKGKSIGYIKEKVKNQKGLVTLLDFLFDPDILLLRNSIAHKDYEIDYESKLITLRKDGNRIKSCNVTDIFNIIAKVLTMNAGYLMAKNAMNFFLDHCQFFKIQLDDKSIHVKISRSYVKLNYMNIIIKLEGFN